MKKQNTANTNNKKKKEFICQYVVLNIQQNKKGTNKMYIVLRKVTSDTY